MKSTYLRERAKLLKNNRALKNEIITDELISGLPRLLQTYLRVCGYMNTPLPYNATVDWEESIFKMSPGKDWKQMKTIQFNTVNPIARTAYMKFSGMPLSARDIYSNGYGEMKGKLFNLISVVFDNSVETAQSALITCFAEFLFIPGYIFSDNVKWETLNDTTLRATLHDNGFEVTGLFHFDGEGFFRHFETNDRYYSIGKNNYKKFRYSAFVDSYKNLGGLNIAENARAMWHLPHGGFEYFKGTIGTIDFNVDE